MGFAHCIRPPPFGASFLCRGSAPTAFGLPHWLCQGSISPAEAVEIVAGWASPIVSGHHPSAPTSYAGAPPLRPSAYPTGFVGVRFRRLRPSKSWPDGLRPLYPATTLRRQLPMQGLRPYGLRPTPLALSGFDFAG